MSFPPEHWVDLCQRHRLLNALNEGRGTGTLQFEFWNGPVVNKLGWGDPWVVFNGDQELRMFEEGTMC